MQVACPADCHYHHAPGACLAWYSATFMLLLPTRCHALMAIATANPATEQHMSERKGVADPAACSLTRLSPATRLRTWCMPVDVLLRAAHVQQQRPLA